MNWISGIINAIRNFFNRLFQRNKNSPGSSTDPVKPEKTDTGKKKAIQITEKFLTRNEFSRPGRTLREVKGIILHWVGKPMQPAIETWNWFENNCPREQHYSSAHYIIDLNGDIIHAIPDNEVAYHCGSSQADPVSGKIYTNWAREQFGEYASNPAGNSPNNCTIGIEMCIVDDSGNFTRETFDAAAELTAKLINENKLLISGIGTHKTTVGWKDCPLLWSKNPGLLTEFRDYVKSLLSAGGTNPLP